MFVPRDVGDGMQTHSEHSYVDHGGTDDGKEVQMLWWDPDTTFSAAASHRDAQRGTSHSHAGSVVLDGNVSESDHSAS